MDEEGARGLLALIVLFLVGWVTISHVGTTNNGQHTGYVTAVEQEGLIWKTWRAYVKTDPQSSQEDSYCVIDPNEISQLQRAEKSRTLVTVNYTSPWLVWKWQCGGEESIIDSSSISGTGNSSKSTTSISDSSLSASPSPSLADGATTPTDPQQYWGYVLQIGGIGSQTIGNMSAQDAYYTDYLLPPKNYITVSFNTPRDLMWVSCKSGYGISDVQSHTGNKIVGRNWSNGQWSNTDNFVGIQLEGKLQNSITVTCQKL